MKTVWFALMLLGVSGVARADLASDIRAVLRDKYLAKVDVGIAMTRLGASVGEKDAVVYRFESDIPLIPASNLKLLTTSAFLDHAGGDFKFRTVLLAKDGDLFLIGDGDPTLGDVEMLKKVGWNATTVFRAWAEELKKRGVTSVRNVFVDDSVFDEQFVHPNWLAKYANARYSAPVAGVNLNANCIDFWIRATSRGQLIDYSMEPSTRYVTVSNACVTGRDRGVWIDRQPGKNDLVLRGEVQASLGEAVSIPVYDPAMYAGTVLAESLAAEGVTVSGAVQRDRTVRERQAKEPAAWTLVAALDTKLATVLARANKDSMNLYAEALCKRLGNDVTGHPGSWENGTAAVGKFLERLGVAADQFKLDDGCGLSRENAISPEALVKVLAHDFHGQSRQLFISSLAIAGVDGTFDKRFKGNLKGRVFGKSGYVSGVSAISGYLQSKDDRWYAFSILMNNCPEGTNNRAKEIQEKIIAAVDDNAR